MKIRDLTYSAVFCAVLCVIAPFSVPLGAVPVSLATFVVYMASAALGAKRAAAAVSLYIALGTAGLPVFSGFEGGASKLCSFSGGFLIGYIFLAALAGFIIEKFSSAAKYPVAFALGTALCYAFGTAWFMFLTKLSLCAALAVCVLPFLLGDALKIAAASALAYKLNKKTLYRRQT